MRRRRSKIAALALLPLGIAVAAGAARARAETTARDCSIAAGRDASNNTITCNFGLTTEQLKEVTKAAVEGATGPLLDRITGISQTLGVTTEAAKTLLRIAGEQPDVSDGRLAEVLTKITNDYKRLQAQAAALNPDNQMARALVTQAKAEIDSGHLAQAHESLRQATRAQIAAAVEARKLREQAQAAEDAQMFGAASSTATDGDVALTERHYQQAADLFGQAAEYVPAGHADDRLNYVDRQAAALYRQGDERGDNDALRIAIEKYHRMLLERTRERVPLDWATTQHNLGNALFRLGERESETAHLDEAVAAYRNRPVITALLCPGRAW